MIQKYFHEINKVAENVARIGSRENTLLAVMITCDSNDTQFINFLALASSAVTPAENLVHWTLIILGCVKYSLFPSYSILSIIFAQTDNMSILGEPGEKK